MEHPEKQTQAVSAGTRNDTGKRAILGSLKKISSLYAVSLLILATVVMGFIWHDLRAEYRDTLAYWNVWLSSSADDEVRVGALWLNERRTDTIAVAESPRVIRLLSAGGSRSKVAQIRQEVERGITHIAAVNGFLGGAVADRDCRIAAQTGIRPEMAQGVQEACQGAQQAGQYQLNAFGMEQGHVWVSLSAPVMAEGRASSSAQITHRMVGSVIMVAEPWPFFLRIFKFQSVAARTSVGLIVWKRASEAFIFSPILSTRGVESLFRRPLNGSTFESRVALAGDVAFGEFIDYRGRPVFGVGRRIGMPGHSLARKVDRDEALSDYRRRVVSDLLVGTLSLLLLGSAMVALHRHAAARGLKEKVKQQQALLELKQHIEVSEERFRELVDSAEAIVWEADGATQKLTFVSQGAEKILGYPTDQWLQTPGFWADHLHPEDRQEALACEREVTEKGQPRSAEYRMKTADGRDLWFRDFMYAVSGPEGKVERLRGIMVDITASKRAEEALLESEGRYRVLFESAGDGILLVRDGHFVDCNQKALELFGCAREQLIGKTPSDLSPPRQPKGQSSQEEELERRRLALEGQTLHFEWQHLRLDGTPFEAEVTLTCVEIAGRAHHLGLVRDVTERKRAEEALRESEARFRTLITDARVAVGVSRNGITLFVNGEFARLFGLENPEETIGRTILDYHAPQCHEWMKDIIRRAQQGLPAPTDFESIGRRKDGSTFPMHCAVSHINLADGPVTLGFLTDLTERKRAEEALRESEERYRTLVDNSPVGIYRTTADGRILAGNPAFAQMLGYSSFEELASRNLNAPDFEPQYSRGQFTEKLEKEGRITGLESEWHRRDGSVILVRENARAIQDEAGRILYYEGTAEDITERKRAEAALWESEERFRSLVQNATVGIYRTTPQGRILMANPTLIKMLGYANFEELAARNLEEQGFDPGHPRRIFRELIERDGEVKGLEAAWVRQDGSTIFVRESARAARDASGNVLYYDGIVEDITDRKQLEQQLIQAQKMEAVGQLAGGVAHDFNNLLTIINGFATLLIQRTSLEDPRRGQLEEIVTAGERAASLTRQLLAFSRRQVLEPVVLDLNSLIANTEKMLRRLIGEDVEMVTTLQPDLGRVKVDAGQIEQVIMNLAVNARDAMPKGGRLLIETSNVEIDENYARSHAPMMPGKYVMVVVSDTGCGMDQETQAHIFEPFFTTKEEGRGTGLGLATVYGIVKQSGGFIWVSSEPGRGSTFKVYLPRVEEVAATAAPVEVPAEPAKGSETVLVVEDEEGVRSLVCEMLASHDYKVLDAAGAAQALQVAEQHTKPIHLLLTDVVMPQISGKELVKRLCALHPETKVLYMSGYTDDAIVRQGNLEAGTSFLQKPFSPEALLQKIREVLKRKPGPRQ
jgi:PAS domain S-box-containing protein